MTKDYKFLLMSGATIIEHVVNHIDMNDYAYPYLEQISKLLNKIVLSNHESDLHLNDNIKHSDLTTTKYKKSNSIVTNDENKDLINIKNFVELYSAPRGDEAIDVSEEIKEHFYVNKTISLEKLGKHYNPDMEDQNHNALDDAILLKNVYEQMKSNNKELNTFTEYLDPHRYPDQVRTILRLNGDTILQEFKNLEEAVAWLKTQPNDKGPQYLKDAAEKIKKAASEGGKYYKSNWRIL